MNAAIGLLSLSALRVVTGWGALSRYFLVLVAAFNLFFAVGYPAYPAMRQFGDWAAVISGLDPQWLWRVLLVIVSAAGYLASMKLIAEAIAPFAATAGPANSRLAGKAR